MRLAASLSSCLAVSVVGCVPAASDDRAGPLHATTDGAIAIANLDHAIERARGADGVELLLDRAQLLADVDALDQAVARAEALGRTAADLLARARARAAVHRFADALGDVAAAERLGAPADQIGALRGSILVATGRAAEELPRLEEEVARRPGFASRAALAAGYAGVGRLDDADRMYAGALACLQTTSPFPYAWTYFARGRMWAEQGNDPARGAAYLRRALAHLPAFATAALHLAELEVARGDLGAAADRLRPIAEGRGEPEALALLGEIELRLGDRAGGLRELARARARFDVLLARHPLAHADHAASFYLGRGKDPERAWRLARQNLAARPTRDAYRLAARAARITGRDAQARLLSAMSAGGSAAEARDVR